MDSLSRDQYNEDFDGGEPAHPCGGLNPSTGRQGDQADERARRLEEILLAAGLGAWEWNVQTGEAVLSERWAEIVGYTLEELAPVSIRTWKALVHPDDLKRSYEAIERCFRGESDRYECEVRMRHKSGDWVWVLDRGNVVERLPDGRPLRMSGTHLDITERKRAEEELAAKEQRYRTLLSMVSEAIFIHRDEKVLDANDAFARLVGFETASEVIGRSCEELFRIHPGAVGLSFCADGGETQDPTDMFLILRDGSSVEVEARAEKIAYEGQPAVLVTMRNLANRRKAEKKIREQKENFEAAFEAIGDMLVVASLDGRVIHANRATSEKLGYPREKLIQMGVLDLHPPERRQEAERTFSDLVAGRQSVCRIPVLTAEGKQIPAETRAWRGVWNGRECMFGLVKDLSDVVEAQRLFEHLFRHNPAPMGLQTVPDGAFCDVNDAFLAKLGYSKAEVMGRKPSEIGMFPDLERLFEAADALRRNGRIDDWELEVRCKDGRSLHGLFSGELLSVQGKQFYLTIMMDITERKRLEHQLREKYKMDFMALLAGGIAHDFNNVLAVILGNVELLKDGPADGPERDAYVEDIEKSAQRAKRLVQQISAFGRHQAENMAFHPLCLLVQEGFRFIRSVAPTNVDLSCTLPKKPLHLRCSSTHIKQLLMFLCSDAWRQLGSAQGKIDISLREAGEPAQAELSVRYSRCDGAPLAPLSCETSRGEPEPAAVSLVEGIVRMHGGAVRLIQISPSESEVVVSFPLGEAPEAGVADLTDEPPAQKLRLLFVDDESDLVVLVKRLLTKSGHEVVGCSRPEEALELLRAEPGSFDAVLTDYNMPTLTGIELAREALAVRPDLPVILISGFVTEEMRAKAREVGIREVLFKEDSVARIAADIASVLSSL